MNRKFQIRTGNKQDEEKVFGESVELWGGGLSLEDYWDVWREIRATEWGARQVEFLTWKDRSGELLSSLKLYRPILHVEGESRRAVALGAIYTPKRHRLRGYASGLIRQVLERTAEEGVRHALLFTDIGTDYYRRFGFRELPAYAASASLDPESLPDRSDVTLIPWSMEYDERVRDAHEAGMRPYTLRIERDRQHWDFLRARVDGFFSRMPDAPYRHRAQMAMRGGEFLGYLLGVESLREWDIREVGSVDGSAEGMAEILRAAASARGPAGLRSIVGWLPGSLIEATPEWNWRVTRRSRAVPMIACLSPNDDSDELAVRVHSFFPYTDQL